MQNNEKTELNTNQKEQIKSDLSEIDAEKSEKSQDSIQNKQTQQ